MGLDTERRHAMPFSGERMRKVRKIKKIRQNKLAEQVKTTQKMISQYERGVYQPNATTLDAIAEALGCSLDYLFGRVERTEVTDLSSEDMALLELGRQIGLKNARERLMLQSMSNRPVSDQ